MSLYVRFSDLNPLAMTPAVDATPAQYHGRNFRQLPQWANIQPWQEAQVYFNPVERGDPFRFEASFDASAGYGLTVIDCNGREVYSFPAPAPTVVGANDGPDGTQLGAYLWKAASLAAIATDGIYYLKLQVGDTEGEREFISEPFELADTHEGTVLLEYRHSTNKLNTFFEQAPRLMRKRVRGWITDFEPGTNSVSFENESGGVTLLDSVPFPRWTFKVGGNGSGIPDATLNILNNIFTCDSVLADGLGYVKEDGAGWEKVDADDDHLQLYGAEIKLREQGNALDYAGIAITLWQQPAYPYAVSNVAVTSFGGGSVPLYTDARIIKNDSDRDAFRADLSTAAANADTLGSVSFVPGTGSTPGRFVFTNGTGGVFTNGSAAIYDQSLPIGYNVGSGQPAEFETYGRSIIVDWGDNSIPGRSSPLLSRTQFSHTYSTAGSKSVRLYFQSAKLREFIAFQTPLTDVFGLLPSSLTKLTLAATAMATFDVGLLFPCRDVLTALAMDGNSNLATLTGSWPVMRACKSYKFMECTLNAANVQKAIQGAYIGGSVAGLTAGYFDAADQTPAVTTQTTTTNNQATQLIAQYGWTVNL